MMEDMGDFMDDGVGAGRRKRIGLAVAPGNAERPGARGLGHHHVIDGIADHDRVGGVDAGNIGTWLAAGVVGFGIGSSLYKPGLSPAEVGQRAKAMVAAWKKATG